LNLSDCLLGIVDVKGMGPAVDRAHSIGQLKDAARRASILYAEHPACDLHKVRETRCRSVLFLRGKRDARP
jgi:hypothetical protein